MPALVSRGRGRRTINEINMVPFIDVMLVLLIVFMVTAPLITPSMVDLPRIGKAGRQPDQVLQVILGKNDSLQLKSRDLTEPVTLGTLAPRVKSLQDGAQASTKDAQGGDAPRSSAVVISADRNVKYEQVIKVMDVLQRAGVQHVGLSVQLVN